MRTQVWKLAGTTIAAAALVALASAPARAQEATDGAQPTSLSSFNMHATFAPDDADASGGTEQQGQKKKHEGFGIGVKGGFPFASFSNLTGLQHKAGWAIGVWFGGNRGGTIGVMGEVLYTKRAVAVSGTTTDLYSLFIPIFLRVNIGQRTVNGLNIYILAGPAFDLQLNQKIGGVSLTNNSKGLDIDVAFGGGVEFLRIIAEARYVIGVKSITFQGLSFGDTNKPRTFFLLFGFRFN